MDCFATLAMTASTFVIARLQAVAILGLGETLDCRAALAMTASTFVIARPQAGAIHGLGKLWIAALRSQ